MGEVRCDKQREGDAQSALSGPARNQRQTAETAGAAIDDEAAALMTAGAAMFAAAPDYKINGLICAPGPRMLFIYARHGFYIACTTAESTLNDVNKANLITKNRDRSTLFCSPSSHRQSVEHAPRSREEKQLEADFFSLSLSNSLLSWR